MKIKRNELSNRTEMLRDRHRLGVITNENDKMLLLRRLNRVMRGFDQSSLLCYDYGQKRGNVIDPDKLYGEVMSELGFDSRCIEEQPERGSALSELQNSTVFKKLYDVIDVLDEPAASLYAQGLSYLAIVAISVMDGSLPCSENRIWADLSSDKIFLYIKPETELGETVTPDPKSIVLSRTLGAELETVLSDYGAPYFKIAVSRVGKFLYEVRRKPKEGSEEAEPEDEESDTQAINSESLRGLALDI